MPVTINGLDPIIAKLDGLDKPEVFRLPMQQSVLHLHGKVATAPTGNQHRPQPFKTDKSRRWFFWALAHPDESGLEVPYKRGSSPGSEKLTSSWTTEVSPDGRQGRIGNDTSYGPLVQDRGQQSAYHAQTGWTTIQEHIEKETPTILGYFEAQYRRYTQR